MVELTLSLKKFLWEKHRDILPLLMFGHVELFTKEIQEEYLAWCGTDEGKKYLEGGEEYEKAKERVINALCTKNKGE